MNELERLRAEMEGLKAIVMCLCAKEDERDAKVLKRTLETVLQSMRDDPDAYSVQALTDDQLEVRDQLFQAAITAAVPE